MKQFQLFFCVALFAMNSFGQLSIWKEQVSGTSEDLLDVDFVNDSTGWAVGNAGTILNTTDKGATWVAQTSNITDQLNGVDFISETTGWAVGNAGTILHTIDGGNTWSAQLSNTMHNIFFVDFVDANNGYALCIITAGQTGGSNVSENTLLKTADGGQTWTVITLSGNSYEYEYTSLYFIDESIGFITSRATSGPYCRRTTDGGITWTAIPSFASEVHEITFVNDTIGWFGVNGSVNKTIDAGQNWTYGINNFSVDLSPGYFDEIKFADENIGLGFPNAWSNFKIIITKNGGVDWELEFTSPTILRGLSVADTTNAWAVGSAGKIYKRTPPVNAAISLGYCIGDSVYFGGDYYSTPGNYEAEVSAASSTVPDTIYDVTISENALPNIATSTVDITISADETNANYQWLDCDNNYSVISGEINQSFTPSLNGNYAVEVLSNGCADTSDCVLINTVGINEVKYVGISYYPNPTKAYVTIDFDKKLNGKIEIYNALGENIRAIPFSGKSKKIDLSAYDGGVYFLHIQTELGTQIVEIILE